MQLNIGTENVVETRFALAKLEYEEENYEAALENVDIIYNLFDEKKNATINKDIIALKSKILEKRNRFKEALEFLKQYQKVSNKVTEEATKMKDGELKGQFSNLEKRYKINEFEINQKLQESQFAALIVAFIFAIIILFFITTMYSRKTACLLYTSPSPRDQRGSRMPSSA